MYSLLQLYSQSGIYETVTNSIIPDSVHEADDPWLDLLLADLLPVLRDDPDLVRGRRWVAGGLDPGQLDRGAPRKPRVQVPGHQGRVNPQHAQGK